MTFPCNTEPCPEQVVCHWADWTESGCSESCGGGTLTRRRTSLGANCTGETTKLELCNQHLCPSDFTAVMVTIFLLAFLIIIFIYCRNRTMNTLNRTPVTFMLESKT